MKRNKYDELKRIYPEYVSLDQVHRICKVAKRTAKYLVENGIIPAIDTGQKSWRYKIAMEDVIDYLQKREQVGSMIPAGMVSSRKNNKVSDKKSFSEVIERESNSDIVKYFKSIYRDYDDVLTAVDIAEITGIEKNSVMKLLRAGTIKSIMTYPKYIVPKPYLLEFVATQRFLRYRTNSKRFLEILEDFEEWKKRK